MINKGLLKHIEDAGKEIIRLQKDMQEQAIKALLSNHFEEFQYYKGQLDAYRHFLQVLAYVYVCSIRHINMTDVIESWQAVVQEENIKSLLGIN